MRKSVFFILAAIALCLCCTRPQRTALKDSSIKIEIDSMADKIKATLAVYLKDSIDQDYYQGAISHAAEMAMDRGISADSMVAIYNGNIMHVDSLVRSAFKLIDEGNLKTWWEKIDEKEMANFYLHPSNIIDNELQLHQAMMYMNDNYLDKQTALERNIKMWNFSDAHCLIMELNDSDYRYLHLFVLENLALSYKDAADSSNAVETAQRFKVIYDKLYPNNPYYANELLDYVTENKK